MKSKSFIISVVSLALAALIGIGGINILIDPLFLYHKPLFGLEPVITNERYQNAGIAKNFDFDNVIIGNSMSQNFKPSFFEDCFNGTTIKLTAAGSHAIDWTYLLEILEKRDKQPQNIIINFDPFIFDTSATETKHYLPDYLYDNNVLNDVNYLFNFSILKDYTFKTLIANLNKSVPETDRLFVWDDDKTKAERFALSDYDRTDKVSDSPDIEESLNLAIENVSLLIPYFESMKETDFTLFFSPFSIVYWDEQNQLNKIELWKTIYSKVCEILVNYDNIHLYLWTDDAIMDIITTLDNYRDSSHYVSEISQEIVFRITNQYGKLTPDNYLDEINKFFEFVGNYDYEQIFVGA